MRESHIESYIPDCSQSCAPLFQTHCSQSAKWACQRPSPNEEQSERYEDKHSAKTKRKEYDTEDGFTHIYIYIERVGHTSVSVSAASRSTRSSMSAARLGSV